MALDLGAVELSVRVRTDNIDRDMGAATAKVKAAAARANAEINVAPKGARELDSAASSADGLSRNLDKAAGSAGKIQPPTSATRGLGEAAAAADQLGRGLDEAAGSSQKIKPNPGVPSSLGEAAAKARELGTELDRAGNEAQELGSSTGGIGSMGGALSGVASTVRGLVPALGAAAAASSALTKGWGRLTSIDNAQFKLQGLGHTAEGTADIMASAMESVSGTAYGFGDAASLAAGTVAATGAEGERLTQILKTVADTSAISGRSLGDMGMIFNQVAASGTLMGDDLNKLMDSGIPVLNMLADELGVTAGEVKKLASDGEISFETFESAMRNNMGGAAQEMGASVTGSLANVGAALGRLGAATLTPGFKALPGALEGVKGGIDSLTEGVGAVTEVFAGLPAPVKATVAALATAKAGSLLLGTEMGGRMVGALSAVRDGLKNSASSVGDFGSSLRDAYRYAGAANPQLGALGRTMEVVGGQGGVASAAMGGMRSAAGGLLTALGGPWGLAIGGATAAVGLFMSQVQKTKKAQEETEAATQAWADVLTQADGQITTAVQKHALLTVEQANLTDQLDKVGISSADAAAAILDLDGSYDSMIDSLDRIIEQGNNDPTALRGRWYTDEAKAAMELRGQIEALHDERVNGVTAAGDAEAAESQLAAEIANSSRESERAQGAHSTLNAVLQEMGIDAKSADDAISNLAGAMMGLSEDPAIRLQSYLGASAAAIKKVSEEVASGGMGGFDIETGMFDEWTDQGRKLTGTMGDVRKSLFEVAAAQYQTSLEMGDSGVVASEKAAAAAREHTDALRDQLSAAGVGKEKIDALFESYGLFPDDIMTQIHVAGSETAAAVLEDLDASMARVDAETHTITVDAKALQMTAEEADALGFKLEDMPKEGLVRLTADTELAQSAIEEIADQTKDLGTADNRVVFRADAIELTEQLNEIEGFTAELVTDPHELKILANTEESLAAIEELGVQTTELPTGEIYVLDNTPDVMKNLEAAGAETVGLPEGNIVITDTSPANIAGIQQLGVETTRLPNGNVVIRDNSAETKKNIENNLASRVLNRTGTVTMKIIENISQVFSRSTGGTIPERAQGGTIPALAAGGNTTHGGYRLPSTGPGTSRTDGILGVDSLGIPTAWVDREEFVTNRARTSEYLNTLWAINSGSKDDVVRALLSDLGGLNSGGVVESITGLVRKYWPMMTVTSTYRGTNDHHGSGLAVDFSNGTDSTPEMRNAAQWFYQYFGSSLLELIHSPFSNNVKNGQNVGDGFGLYGAGTMGQHRNHVHVAAGSPLPDPGTGEVTAGMPGAPTASEMSGMTSAVGDLMSVDAGTTPRAEHHATRLKEGSQSGIGSTVGRSAGVAGLANNTPRGNMRDAISGALVAHPDLQSYLGQAEGSLRAAGFGAEVDRFMGGSAPSFDVFLKVSPETIEALDRLKESEVDRSNAALDVIEAEKDLAEAKKALAKSDADAAEKISDARKAVEDARNADEPDQGKIDKAQKKLDKLIEETPENAAKAAEKIHNAELKLSKAREAESRSVDEVTEAQEAYNQALREAPFKAVAASLDVLSQSFMALGDSLQALDDNLQNTKAKILGQVDAELAAVAAKEAALDAERALRAAERDGRSQRHADALAVQQAEFDLAMLRAESAEMTGGAEIDLALIREAGIFHTLQTSDAATREQIAMAARLQAAEQSLAHSRAVQALNDYQMEMAQAQAADDVALSQALAELQAQRLAIASAELAVSAARAAEVMSQSSSALAQVQQGAGGIFGGLGKIFGNLGAIIPAVLAAPMTGGLSLLGAAPALLEAGGGLLEMFTGGAKVYANAGAARDEWNSLDGIDKLLAGLSIGGTVLGGVGGAYIAGTGGSRDDVENTIALGSMIGRMPLEIANAFRRELADADERRAAGQLSEVEYAEKILRLDHETRKYTRGLEDDPQLQALLDLVALSEQEVNEHQQENEQLAQLNSTLAPKNQSVLMQLGGSAWGDGTGGPSLADMSAGFGGITAGMVDPWSSVSVEGLWGDVSKGRMIAPWDVGEGDGPRSPILGLPDGVVGGGHVPAGGQSSGSVDAAAVERLSGLMVSMMQQLMDGLTAGDVVETQFTGDVTITGSQAADIAAALAEELARA